DPGFSEEHAEASEIGVRLVACLPVVQLVVVQHSERTAAVGAARDIDAGCRKYPPMKRYWWHPQCRLARGRLGVARAAGIPRLVPDLAGAANDREIERFPLAPHPQRGFRRRLRPILGIAGRHAHSDFDAVVRQPKEPRVEVLEQPALCRAWD